MVCFLQYRDFGSSNVIYMDMLRSKCFDIISLLFSNLICTCYSTSLAVGNINKQMLFTLFVVYYKYTLYIRQIHRTYILGSD